MLLFTITLGVLLVGVTIYSYIKTNKLKNEAINYKVKYESVKVYVEELTKNSTKTSKDTKAAKVKTTKKSLKSK